MHHSMRNGGRSLSSPASLRFVPLLFLIGALTGCDAPKTTGPRAPSMEEARAAASDPANAGPATIPEEFLIRPESAKGDVDEASADGGDAEEIPAGPTAEDGEAEAEAEPADEAPGT